MECQLLHSIKSYTAHAINAMLGTQGTVWQRESYDHIVRDLEQRFQDYIHANPSKAGLGVGRYLLSEKICCVED